jgi:hypothetical protein
MVRVILKMVSEPLPTPSSAKIKKSSPLKAFAGV